METGSRCLVTGAAGFIGSTLARRLLDEGHQVTGLDCLDDYYDPALKRERLARLAAYEGFEFIEESLADAPLDDLLSNADYVFHLAGRPGVRASWGGAFDLFLRDNVLATQRLLEAARGTAVRRVVYASSSSVYGDAETYPTSEDVRPRPLSPYGVTKLAAEHLCTLYGRVHDVPTVSLRYFTVYGPEQRPDMAFNKFIAAAVAGQPIDIYGDGAQTRDFTFVGDVVDANLLAADFDAHGAVFNIGGGSRVRLIELIRVLEHHLGRAIDVRFVERQDGDASDTAAEITRARELLGYQPRVPIEEGLGLQVAWQLEQIGRHTGATR